MSSPFVGEIRLFGGNFAPRNWALCNGQTLAISQNQALFALIGTTFGGNGVSTFQLPNLQGRVAIGQGAGLGLAPRTLGQTGGEESVTLTPSTMPAHTHALNASTTGANSAAIGPTVLPGSLTSPMHFYTVNDGSPPPPTSLTLSAGSVSVIGGSQSHNNMMPSLCVTYIISMFGVFPSRN
jgi:microcystin-dependent protein